MKYLKRIVENSLNNKMQTFGGVLIVGPKGCGKTTTAKQYAKSVIEFQDEVKRESLLSVLNINPTELLKNEKPILFDEWQDGSKIWDVCRKSIDDLQQKGLYLFTGSSSQSVKTHHTGTGRISTLVMRTMSLYETGESSGSVSLKDLFDNKSDISCTSTLTYDDLIFAICRGGWPNALNVENKTLQLEIAKDLYNQIVNVDIKNISGKKRNSETTNVLLRSYARNISTLASTKTIMNDINTEFRRNATMPTILDYIDDLKKLYIIEDIESWTPNIRSKCNIRSSIKRNFVDPSIAVNALKLSPEYFSKDYKTLGFLFESLCIRDLKIYSQAINGNMYFYRDRFGLEADAVLFVENGNYALVEFKLGANNIEEGAQNLNKIEQLIKEYNLKEENKIKLSNPTLKIVITGSQYGYKREDGVYVIPIGCLKD